MKIETESMILENKQKQRLRIYKVEGGTTYCIGVEGEEHFEFEAKEAAEICQTINRVVAGE